MAHMKKKYISLSSQANYQSNHSDSIGCVEAMWEILPLNQFYAEINVCTEEGLSPDYHMNMISKTYKYIIIPIQVSNQT